MSSDIRERRTLLGENGELKGKVACSKWELSGLVITSFLVGALLVLAIFHFAELTDEVQLPKHELSVGDDTTVTTTSTEKTKDFTRITTTTLTEFVLEITFFDVDNTTVDKETAAINGGIIKVLGIADTQLTRQNLNYFNGNTSGHWKVTTSDAAVLAAAQDNTFNNKVFEAIHADSNWNSTFTLDVESATYDLEGNKLSSNTCGGSQYKMNNMLAICPSLGPIHGNTPDKCYTCFILEVRFWDGTNETVDKEKKAIRDAITGILGITDSQLTRKSLISEPLNTKVQWTIDADNMAQYVTALGTAQRKDFNNKLLHGIVRSPFWGGSFTVDIDSKTRDQDGNELTWNDCGGDQWSIDHGLGNCSSASALFISMFMILFATFSL